MLRHDWAVILAATRHSLRDRSNLLTALIGVPILLLVASAGFAKLPPDRLSLLTAALGLVIGFALVRSVGERLRYHQTEGALGSFAFGRAACIGYGAVFLGVGLLMAGTLVLVLAEGGFWMWLAGVGAGAIAGALWLRVVPWLGQHLPIISALPGLPQLRHDRSPIALAGAGFGAGLFCTLLPYEAAAAVAVALCVGASLLLGRVTQPAVRFMTMVGHSSWSIVEHHLKPVLCFALPFATAPLLAGNWLLAVVSTASVLGVLLLLMLLALSYRVFSRQLAEWVVVLLVAFAANVGLAIPVAAPAVLLAGVLWLGRRSRHASWLIT